MNDYRFRRLESDSLCLKSVAFTATPAAEGPSADHLGLGEEQHFRSRAPGQSVRLGSATEGIVLD